ncbi:MAG: Na+/H+ antiporter subunit E [Sumerlaeia bacterium]
MTTDSRNSKETLKQEFQQNTLSTRAVVVAVFVILISFFFIDWAPIIFAFAFVIFLFTRIINNVASEKLPLGKRLINTAFFVQDFLIDLVKSNLMMSYDILTSKDYHNSHMFALPIDDLTQREVALLSHRITLTPGTLSCLVDKDANFLLVHTMYKKPTNEDILSLRAPIDILKGKDRP